DLDVDQQRTTVVGADTDEEVQFTPAAVRTSGEELLVQQLGRRQVQAFQHLGHDQAQEVWEENAQQLLEDLVVLGGHGDPGSRDRRPSALSLHPYIDVKRSANLASARRARVCEGGFELFKG